MSKKRIIIYLCSLIILAGLLILSFLPLWKIRTEHGHTMRNSWDKIMIITGQLHID